MQMWAMACRYLLEACNSQAAPMLPMTFLDCLCYASRFLHIHRMMGLGATHGYTGQLQILAQPCRGRVHSQSL